MTTYVLTNNFDALMLRYFLLEQRRGNFHFLLFFYPCLGIGIPKFWCQFSFNWIIISSSCFSISSFSTASSPFVEWNVSNLVVNPFDNRSFKRISRSPVLFISSLELISKMFLGKGILQNWNKVRRRKGREALKY